MLDPLVVAAAVGVVGSVTAGPAMGYGLEFLPRQWRKSAAWALVAAALLAAILADVVFAGPVGGAFVYVLAALPGIVAFLAFRTILASLFVSLLPFYLVIGELTRSRTAHTPAMAVDRLVPLQPEWMLVYGSLYVFVACLPALVVRQGALFRRATQAYLAVMMISYLGFLWYPTVAPRPDIVAADDFAAWSLRGLYGIDPPHGCFPSLHVAYSFVSALTCYRVHRGVGIAAAMWAALIGVSTLFVKQHYAIDVIAGVLLAWAAYVIFLQRFPREEVGEADLRRAPRRALGIIPIYVVMIAGFWVAYVLDW
jgi:membrane-associated phospholipid phosphatase